MKFNTQDRYHRFVIFLVLLVALPLLGALLGRWAGPSISRIDYSVQVAERLYLEERDGLAERTLQTEAYRAQGYPFSFIYERATRQRRNFVLGSTILGVWLGLVIAMKIGTTYFSGKRDIYEADYAYCLACARCFEACPIEHKRVRDSRGSTHVESASLNS
jgi:ferredoxin